jgi:hypothetical protein
MRYTLGLVVVLSLMACGAAAQPADGAFTLYRSSVAITDARMHVATFDASDGAAYNRENCETAARLFAAQPAVTVRFWCEPGRFHE